MISKESLTQTILYIDSRGENIQCREKVFRNWVKYTKDRKKDIQLASTLWRMGEYEHIKQTDNTNCGVFVCYFYKMLINPDYGLPLDILILMNLDQQYQKIY